MSVFLFCKPHAPPDHPHSPILPQASLFRDAQSHKVGLSYALSPSNDRGPEWLNEVGGAEGQGVQLANTFPELTGPKSVQSAVI